MCSKFPLAAIRWGDEEVNVVQKVIASDMLPMGCIRQRSKRYLHQHAENEAVKDFVLEVSFPLKIGKHSEENGIFVGDYHYQTAEALNARGKL